MIETVYLSGIQATGVPHIGNYIGAISQWITPKPPATKSYYMVADLHAITTPNDPSILKQNRIMSMAGLIACGLNPSKDILFFQSSISEHSELMWLLASQSYLGELNRMTQFKTKSNDDQEISSLALFGYPVLQAADILLYQSTHVPVGADQIQHIELVRDIAVRFNNRFEKVFTLPSAELPVVGARIMDLQHPNKKMSKSGSNNTLGTIFLNDSNDLIRKKINKAVTDTCNNIAYSTHQPGLYNLISIFAAISNTSPHYMTQQFAGKGYGLLKKELIDKLISVIEPIRTIIEQLSGDEAELFRLIDKSTKQAKEQASTTIQKTKNAMGF